MIRVLTGDSREVLGTLPKQSVQCVVTSPPYWGLRKYGADSDMIGMEPNFDDHIRNLRRVFKEVWRVLKDDGTLWLNYGDAYYQKNLMLMPSRIALALHNDGWHIRSEIIWHKTAVMPESARDRPSNITEKIFLLTKNKSYFYNYDAVALDAKSAGQRTNFSSGRKDFFGDSPYYSERKEKEVCFVANKVNMRNVWSVGSSRSKLPHFAVMPEKIIEPCILAGSRVGDMVLDPFGGIGSVALTAHNLQRNAVIVEINAQYADFAVKRIKEASPILAEIHTT